MGSIPVGSTKTTVKTVVFLTPTWNRRTPIVVPIPVRSAGSLMHGSTKRLIIFSRFFNPDLESKDAYRRPASRTLGRLADAREYQNDCEDSRFYMMRRKD